MVLVRRMLPNVIFANEPKINVHKDNVHPLISMSQPPSVEKSCKYDIMSDMGAYPKEKELGRGSFGSVYLAKDSNGRSVAIKKQALYEGGEIHSASVREVSIMIRLCKGTNENYIIPMEGLGLNKDNVFIVMPAADQDLKKFIEGKKAPLDFKYVSQIVSGVAYLHSKEIIHRDLKPQNILYDATNDRMMIADFGLSRGLICSGGSSGYTHEIITLWYRPPEILLGGSKYGYKVDVWSLGCILYEMYFHKPLFKGDSAIDQLFHIFRVLGVPDNSTWPGVENYPEYKTSFPKWIDQSDTVFDISDPGYASLIRRALVMDPDQRATSHEMLENEYCTECSIPRYTCLDNLYLRSSEYVQTVYPTEVNNKMIQILIDWLIDVSKMFKLRHRTLFLGVYFVRRFLAKITDMPRAKVQLYGCLCLYLASTVEEIMVPELNDFVVMCDGAYTQEDMIEGLRILMPVTQFDLVWATPVDFIHEYCRLFYQTGEFMDMVVGFAYIAMNYLFRSPRPGLTKAHEIALWSIWHACYYYNLEYKHDHLVSEELIKKNQFVPEKMVPFTAGIKMLEKLSKLSLKTDIAPKILQL